MELISELILVRHGNTFNSSEEAVRVGLKQDLPLVLSGEKQAEDLGIFLKKYYSPEVILSAELKRTQRFAEILQQFLRVDTKTDPCLNEIDYGEWGGLNNSEIEERFSKTALENWDKKSVWPENANWQPGEREVIKNVFRISKESLKYKSVLLVSSNGILRYFLKLIEGAFKEAVENNSFKMQTGSYSVLKYKNKAWTIDKWNQKP